MSRSWRWQWLQITLTAAVAATAIDAVLLQRKRSYFTGGFLSVDHVRNPIEGAAFLLSSVAADAAVIGVLVAATLWLCGRLALSRRLSWTLALVVGLGPFVVANVVTYQLLAYLGDAFDFALMFDLVGRNPSEIVAVSSEHLTQFAVMLGAALLILVALGWVIFRWGRHSPSAVERVRLLRAVALPLLLCVAGMVGLVALRRSSDVLDNGLRRKPTGRLLAFVADTLADVDRDGFGVLGRPTDPAPFNGRIHPYAYEVPGNGIDDNGVGGDFPARTAIPSSANSTPPVFGNRPNVILIVLESFRADALGATFDNTPVTPILNALAARGASARAYSHNGYTAQSRNHLFTGALDSPPRGTTLLDDFKANGYETAFFSAQDESFGGPDLEVGFTKADHAFDARQDIDNRYTAFTTAGSLGLPFDVLNGHIRKFLESRRRDRPLFMYVNFYDTHFPYHHRKVQPLVSHVTLRQFEIGPSRVPELRAMYLNTVANVDRAIGELMQYATTSLGGEPAVIITADHGESLFDEGFLGHGYALNEVQTRIPFVTLNLPLSIPEPIGQADLRDGVRQALARTTAAAPRGDAKRVFQYLGTIERPAQIGFISARDQIVYDFRINRVRFGDGAWQHPDSLPADQRAAWLDLVHTWEGYVLSRRRGDY